MGSPEKEKESLQRLLGAEDPDHVRQGCELLLTLAARPDFKAFAMEITEDTDISAYNGIEPGAWIEEHVQSDLQHDVALYAARAAGALVREINSSSPFNERNQGVFICRSDRLRSLDVLTGMSEIKRLEFYQCASLRDLTPVASLGNLEELGFAFCRLGSSGRDLGVLSGLDQLRILQICDLPDLVSLDGLSTLKHLRVLEMLRCKNLRSLDGLHGLSALESIHLDECLLSLGHLTDLTGLQGLQELKFTQCHSLQDLDWLRELTGLRQLTLTGCRSLKDCSGLSGLENLESLTIGGEGLDLRALAGLHNLTSLSLEGTFSNLEVVADLKSLTELSLSKCPGVENVDSLSGATHLTKLSLGDCDRLTQVDGLVELKGLTSLWIRDCPLIQPQPGEGELKPWGPVEETSASVRAYLTRVQDAIPTSEGAKALRADRMAVIQLLKGGDLYVLHQGCERLMAMAEEPENRPFIECCEEAMARSDGGDVVSLWVSRALGRWDEESTLDLSDQENLYNVDFLSGLQALRELDLSGCSVLQDLSGLFDLADLSHLNLSGCPLLSPLPEPAELVGEEHIRAYLAAVRRALSPRAIGFGSGPPSTPESRRVRDSRAYLYGCIHQGRRARQWPDNQHVLTGCRRLMAMAGEAELRGIVTELAEGTRLTTAPDDHRTAWARPPRALGVVQLGRALHDVVGDADHAQFVGLWVLRAAGALDGVEEIFVSCDFLSRDEGPFEVFEGLENLKRLNLAGAQGFMDLSGLSELPQLTELDLTGFAGPPPMMNLPDTYQHLAGLQQLERLVLKSNIFLEHLDFIADLPGLTHLNLEDCRLDGDKVPDLQNPIVEGAELKSLQLQIRANLARPVSWT